MDANQQAATGHLMRCLAIAEEFKNRKIEVVFISAECQMRQMVEDRGFMFFCLNSYWQDLNSEIPKMAEYIQEKEIEKLIIDSYFITDLYLRELSYYTKLIYIDDLGLIEYPIALLINYNIYYRQFSYVKRFQNTKTKLLLGSSFAPLRKEFQSVPLNYRMQVKNVLLTTGGTDQYNAAKKILKKLETEEFLEITFHVVAGNFNTYIDELAQIADDRENVVLYKNISNMAELMMKCDIAITAGGTTLYELCSCGKPAISFAFADNQLFAVQEFQKQEIIEYAGDIRDNEGIVMGNIYNFMRKYLEDYDLRKERAIRMKEKIDGRGVQRVADAVIDL